MRSTGTARGVREQGGLWFYRSLILNFARRDLRARFKGSLFGLLWSLIVPMASLGTYALVFGTFFGGNAPKMGHGHAHPFAVWLFTGLVVWNMFFATVLTAIGSLVGNGPLMKKIYFPGYASVFGSVVATFYQSLIEVGILVIALAAYGNFGWTWLLVIGWFVLFGIFVAAVALFLAVANIHWRDVQHFVGIALQLMFYMTPIIFTLDQVAARTNGTVARVLRVMPIATFVEVFRSLMYGLEPGAGRAWLAMVGWTVVAVLAARALYSRRGLDLSEEL